MKNDYVTERLNGLLCGLNNTYCSTASSASASKGAARSDFIDSFLKQVIPSSLRIATGGEVTDNSGAKSGELDIIIENGFFPSLPVLNVDSSRLYFAEGVACVVEVKSNLQGQWGEALGTGEKLSRIKREIKGGTMMGSSGPVIHQLPGAFNNPNLPKMKMPPKHRMKEKIPYFVVGYRGWTNPDTIRKS